MWPWYCQFVKNLGKFMAARATHVKGVFDPLAAEAMAGREGLLFAAVVGLDRALLEVDSQPMIKLIQNKNFKASTTASAMQKLGIVMRG